MCADILLTDSFLERIRNARGSQYGLLPSYARFPECSGPGVAQINRIWAALPKAMRDNRDLRRRIRNYKREETFWGGFSEASVAHFLQIYRHEFEYSPEISGKTPDFSLQIDGRRYLIEITASSGDKGWDDYSEEHRLLKEELFKVDLPFRIYIVERTRDRNRNYHGLAAALTTYLASPSPVHASKDDEHAVSTANGGTLTFKVDGKTDAGRATFVGPGYEGGMPNPDKVREVIANKARKYSDDPMIPIVVVYFCTTPIAEPARILIEALDGSPVLRSADGDTPGEVETWWESSGKGMWGAQNRDAGKYPHLHGVVAVTVGYSEDLMQFRVAKAIRPERRDGLVGFLPEVPDVFMSGAFEKADPLVVVP